MAATDFPHVFHTQEFTMSSPISYIRKFIRFFPLLPFRRQSGGFFYKSYDFFSLFSVIVRCYYESAYETEVGAMKNIEKSSEKPVSISENLNIIYSNMQITRIETNPGTGLLTITGAFAQREAQKILYENVFFSQIDQSDVGERIAIAIELTPDELRGADRKILADRLIKDCGLTHVDTLDEIARRGYRFFAHYIVNQEERVIIAKGLSVRGC